jgi:hypothetical protein
MVITGLAPLGEGDYMMPLIRIFIIIIEDWGDNSGGGYASVKWVEQYLHFELHLQWKKETGSITTRKS